ncbi:uncharacterized protein LOC141662008 [Apium graveolens]|uniref:uncharacterized protein LOC141662008 n=1 Tax=Apium graveolens TaxID=4045 RepID=UPI003D78F920
MYVLVKGDGATPLKKSPLLSRIFLGYGVGFPNQGSNVLDINWLAYSGVRLTTTLALFCSNTGLQKNDKRERVVKASRDITINSIKVIFQVHRYGHVFLHGHYQVSAVYWSLHLSLFVDFFFFFLFMQVYLG